MEVFHRKILIAAFKIFDVIVMTAIFALAAALVSYRIDTISFDQFLHVRIKIENFVLFLIFILFWHILFSIFGLYHSKRLSVIKSEIKDIIKATSLGTLIIFVLSIIFRVEMINPVFLATFWIGTTSVSIMTRIVLRFALRKIRLRGRNLRFLLIAGTNERALRLARKIKARTELGYRLVGFVDEKWMETTESKKNGYKLVTDFNNLQSFLKDNVVDEVIIALPMKSLYSQAQQIMSICEEQGIIVRYLSDLFNSKQSRSNSDYFEGQPLVSHYTGAINGWRVAVKRIMDFAISGLLLALLSPLLLLTTILIKLYSPGPAFFTQERVGRNKRRFRLFKFRTMVDNAEQQQAELEKLNEVTGPVFKIINDPRITHFGRFLRKTSIDELPQLINVLKGDMSLVGPRPLPMRDYNGFDKDWHRRRFSVRPGITCLWQVNGRSRVPFEKWMQLDMQYIDRWSLWLDLTIMVKTVPVVIRGFGAS